MGQGKEGARVVHGGMGGGWEELQKGGKAWGTDESWWEKGVRRVSEWVLAAWL